MRTYPILEDSYTARYVFGSWTLLRAACNFLCLRIGSQLILVAGFSLMPGNIVSGACKMAACMTFKERMLCIRVEFLARLAFRIKAIPKLWVGVENVLNDKGVVSDCISLILKRILGGCLPLE
jgi:hypothetical protein